MPVGVVDGAQRREYIKFSLHLNVHWDCTFLALSLSAYLAVTNQRYLSKAFCKCITMRKFSWSGYAFVVSTEHAPIVSTCWRSIRIPLREHSIPELFLNFVKLIGRGTRNELNVGSLNCRKSIRRYFVGQLSKLTSQ